MANNKLELLPGGIGFLTRLTDLSVHHNKLQVLPNDMTNLRSKFTQYRIVKHINILSYVQKICRSSKIGHHAQ